ncbi:MAG: mismatch repair protein [Acidobacteriia bacterium]|nr:mismatch repair protein [Terriglobia bacterium]
MPDPRAEYGDRLESRARTVATRERSHIRIGNSKLAVVAAALVLVWLCFARHLVSARWLLLPVAAYVVLAILHERIIRARTRAETAAAFYRAGIARIEDRWSGTGASGERFGDEKHVYASDLDLFGRGCLFELLSTARLPMGENRLAEWLCRPSPVKTIVERQGLIAELRPKLDLREDLAVTGEELRVRLNPESLTKWCEGTPVLGGTALRVIAAAFAFAAAAAFIYFVSTAILWPFLAVLIVEGILYAWLQRRAIAVISEVHCNAEGLVLFSKILARLEKEPFASPRLQQLAAELKRGAEPGSRAIRRFARIVNWIDAHDSLIARMMNLPLLYTIQTALAAEAWRKRWGSRMRVWIDIVGEIEALLSLAAYSFEHPGDPFPEFADQGDAPALFAGEELGHPLMPALQCVRNSVQLDATTRVLLVSGSNMSGKSTFLRTVGINTVLAMAGAPIRGKSLRMAPLRLGTRLRSIDSLQEGRSTFYTELLRIRQVFDLANGDAPVLFLFDELLDGTNSHDRRIGAESLVGALLERGAIGIVTTHDLALTEMTKSLGAIVRNSHFQDYVEGGKMRFDYKLRDGVVTKSNALELMRLVGLKV